MVSVRFSVKDIQMFLMIVLLFEIFSTWSSGCGYKETLPPHELIWYVYLNDDLDVFFHELDKDTVVSKSFALKVFSF